MKRLDIKRALAEHNMSQIELAQKSGIIAPNISAIIKSGNPTVARLTKIAEGIGCDITDLFYPDPAEESAEIEKALESAKNSKMPLELILRDLTRRAYPSITKEETDEWMEVIRNKNMVSWFDINPSQRGAQNIMENLRRLEEARKKHEGQTRGDLPEGFISRDVKFVQQAAENEPTYQVHENGLVSENQQMIQTSTFCPHCGKKVRVGVILMDEE
nr:MAG TPA: helix-turn-helix domain protein [Bacteriophage sp.]